MNPPEAGPPHPFSLREADECVRQGNEAVRRGRLEEAYAAWRKAVAIDPTRAEILDKPLRQLRARLVQAALAPAREADADGRYADAAIAFRRVLAYEPDDPAVRREAEEGLSRADRRMRLRRRALAAGACLLMLAATAGLARLVYALLQ